MAKPLSKAISSMDSKISARGRRRSMKAAAAAAAATPCIPRRFKSSGNVATPMSLLERFREVVLRLIMFSAISKGSPSSSRSSQREASPPARPCRHQDSYRSEAVEDCIEFFKRSAGSSDVAKSSNVSEDSVDVSLGVLPLSPVVGL